jgi:RNA polymerase sigma factor (sigma-70 family)
MPLRELYDSYHNMVFNIALQYLQNIEDAEEVTQDVFLKVNNKLKFFEKRSDIKTWIYRISINTALDFAKAKRAKKRWFFAGVLPLADSSSIYERGQFNHPGVLLEQKEELQILFGAINRLPDRQRTALILLKIEGKTSLETAEIMQLSAKAVESLLQRAKMNLQSLINNKRH